VSADQPLTGDELATIKARAEAATPGPWRYDDTKVHEFSREESVFAGPRGVEATTVASTGPCDDPQSMKDAEHIAGMDSATTLRMVAEIERLRARQSRVDALFSGGPDTPCRTTWYEVNPGNDHFCTTVECVEVPMADLREALAP